MEEAQQGDRLTFGDIVIEVGEVQQHPMFTERVLTLIKGENKVSQMFVVTVVGSLKTFD